MIRRRESRNEAPPCTGVVRRRPKEATDVSHHGNRTIRARSVGGVESGPAAQAVAVPGAVPAADQGIPRQRGRGRLRGAKAVLRTRPVTAVLLPPRQRPHRLADSERTYQVHRGKGDSSLLRPGRRRPSREEGGLDLRDRRRDSSGSESIRRLLLAGDGPVVRGGHGGARARTRPVSPSRRRGELAPGAGFARRRGAGRDEPASGDLRNWAAGAVVHAPRGRAGRTRAERPAYRVRVQGPRFVLLGPYGGRTEGELRLDLSRAARGCAVRDGGSASTARRIRSRIWPASSTSRRTSRSTGSSGNAKVGLGRSQTGGRAPP